MPLTETGKSVLEDMRETYGDKKGESVFYASINAKKKGSSKWHKKRKRKQTSGRFSQRALSAALSKS